MQDLDVVRGDQREVGQVLVGQHYHVAGGQFVALGHVGEGTSSPSRVQNRRNGIWAPSLRWTWRKVMSRCSVAA